jgi:predicted CXXCH cytochrome family protein
VSRLPLLIALAAVLGVAWLPASAGAQAEPHLEPGTFLEDCSTCHRGHGASGSPMLDHADDRACLGCHSARAASASDKARLGMSATARPFDIAQERGKAAAHRGALCRDCHSVHGVPGRPRTPDETLVVGSRRNSTKRGFTDQADLCLSCHGSETPQPEDPGDIGLLLDPSNPSYHPVRAVAKVEEVPSLVEPLTTTSIINCTDCHRSDDPKGSRGPHGSGIPGLLGAGYVRQDGQAESATAYALCYSCHDRQVVLTEDAFPYHDDHVVVAKVPCAACHDPHGATKARALVLFNEPTPLTGVTPSGSDRLEFVSEGPGMGTCFLTCHGVDHDPLGYGPGFTDEGRPLVAEAFERLVPDGPPPSMGGTRTPRGAPGDPEEGIRTGLQRSQKKP